MVLLGPADADHFRTKVGRYGDRWYTDPLPGCQLAEASDWAGPSISATKPPFANKYVPMRAIADMPAEDWKRLAGKNADERYEAIKSHDKIAGRANMDRGSIVHRWAEDRLFGRPISDKFLPGSPAALEQAKRFRPALEAFFDTYQPELVAAETVCIHRTLNGVGYGGTTDAIVRIDGDLWDIDWKSRNSDHDCYPEEAGQGGGYIGAEYMIVAGPDGNPMRVAIPKVAGVLIVSIREDGFRAYPVDRDGAIKHYEAMHRWWCAQQDLTANKVIGRPWAPKNAAGPQSGAVSGCNQDSTPGPLRTPALDDRRAALRRRYDLLNDEQKAEYTVRKRSIDTNNLDAVETLLDEIDPIASISLEPVPQSKAEPPKALHLPDEGDTVDALLMAGLKRQFEQLSDEAKFWIGTLTAQGRNAGVDWRTNVLPSERRYMLARGIVRLAKELT